MTAAGNRLLLVCLLVSIGCAKDHTEELEAIKSELEAEKTLHAETRKQVDELKELVTKLEEAASSSRFPSSRRRPVGPFGKPPDTSHLKLRVAPKGAQLTSDELAELIDGKIEKVDDNRYRIADSLRDRILDDPGALPRGARGVPWLKDNIARGVKLYAIRPSSVYAKIGLLNGDAIESINGHKLGPKRTAEKAFAALRYEDVVVLELSRRGRPAKLTYEFY